MQSLENVLLEIPPEQLFGADSQTQLQGLAQLRRAIDRQIDQATDDNTAADILSTLLPVSSTVTPTTVREKLSALHDRLKSKLQRCSAMLVSLHEPATTQTRSVELVRTESRRVVDMEAGALLDTCENAAEDDDIIMSQYGTTTANVRKIQSCCACQLNPICNLLLPCCHGVCHDETCTNLTKCPVCNTTLETVARLHIYIE